MKLNKLHKLAICITIMLNAYSFISAHTHEIVSENFTVSEKATSRFFNSVTDINNYSRNVEESNITDAQNNKSIAAGWFIYRIDVDGNAQTSETGTTDTFEVKLSLIPSSDVVINITGLDTTEGKLDKTQLIFTSANYNIPQKVIVTGVDDPLIDGDITYTLNLKVVNALSDSHYANASTSVNVKNIDDDVAGISVSLSANNTITSEKGTSDTILVELDAQPATDVVIDISNLDNTEGSLDKNQLTFTNTNWNTPQMVIVTGVDDDIIDGDITYPLYLIVDPANSDDKYDLLSDTVYVTNLDDDVAGISVSLSANNTITSETGISDTILVELDAQPATDVVIDISNLDTSEGSLDKTQLTFTNTNWNTPQTIIVTGVDDDIIDGDITYTLYLIVDPANSDDKYDLLSDTVYVTNLDDDVAGISVSLSANNNLTSETGTSDTIIVELDAQPATDVVIKISNLDNTEGSLDKTQLTFTNTNWNTPQTIIVTGVDDDIVDGDITYTLNFSVVDASSDDKFDGLSVPVYVTNLDDDVAGISVSLSANNNLTSETGTSDTIVVELDAQPVTDVVIDISNLDNTEGSLDKTQLTFTNTNWNTPQTIIVTGVDDDIIDGDITYTLNFSVVDASSDDKFDGLSVSVYVTNLDDDVAGISVSLSANNTITSETGTSDTIVVELDAQPATDVVINITGLDASEGSLDKTQITFTGSNWNTPQIIVVTGVDDDLEDGDITYTLNLIVDDASSDDNFDGLSKTVDVTNLDDDMAGIKVSLSDGSNLTSETGTSDTIVIVLNTQPATDVVINIKGLDTSEGSLDKSQIIFTNTNWDTPQTVIVTGVDDELVDGDITYTLNLVVDDANSDDNYDGLSTTVDVTNIDDDLPGFTIALTGGNNITSETGTSDKFSVVLNTQPQDKVVIDLSGVDATEGSIDIVRLVFTNANWDIPQTVTVTGKDDDLVDGDITYTIALTVNNVGSDDTYDGLIKTTNVTNLDDEYNNPPLINDETITILQGDTATGNLLANDSDPDGDNLIINTTPVTDASYGTVVINPDGSYSYIPNDITFTGTDYFEYEVCDDGTPQECSTGTVTITINIKDSDGDDIPDWQEEPGDCDDDGILNIYDPDPCPEEDIDIPGGFSPNNDGNNDHFVIPGIELYDNVSLIVFNRWGNIVYENNHYENDWDGKSNSTLSKGKDLPIGTYFYQVLIKDINLRLTGYVYLNR